MEFKDFENKIVAVLNKNIEIGRAMNALAHMSFGLGGSVQNKEDMRLQDYTDADGGKHPQISDLPFIVLRGGSGQISNLRKACVQNNIHFTDFTNTMIEGTYIQQHERTQKTKEEDLKFFGICLFGDWETVSKLTKKFSLWK
jgi:hypothetical protein